MASRRKQREFGRLFEGAARQLWIVASATAPQGAVDDVLQESALIGLNRFSSFQRGTRFSAWMAQIVRNVARNQARRHSRTKGSVAVDELVDELPCPSTPFAPATTDGGELLSLQSHIDDSLARALHTLSADARACLLLSVVDELPHGEIAQLLELPVGTVASHIHRARAVLRAELAPAPETSQEDVCDEASELAK